MTATQTLVKMEEPALTGLTILPLPEIDDKMADRGSFGALKMAADLVVKCMGTKRKMECPHLKQLPDYLPRSE